MTYKAERSELNSATECASITMKYVPQGEAAQYLNDEHLMALVKFGKPAPESQQDPRIICVDLPPLDPENLCLAIRSLELPQFGVEHDVSFCQNNDILFGHIYVDEQRFQDIHNVAQYGYDKLVNVIENQGYPHLLRVWNYMPEINKNIQAVERYRSFCTGRYETLKQRETWTNEYPAASAIGTAGSGVLIYFLASTQAGIQIENPRQVSAFKYPKQYGETSPSFSRATLKQWGAQKHLYISGTASIVGYESQHEGHTLRQLDETLNNLNALIESCRKKTDIELRSVADLSLLTVYLRNHEEYGAVKQQVDSILGQHAPVMYLQGDICRRDLALEIEGVYMGG